MTIPRNLSTLASGVDANGVLGAAKGGTGSTTTFTLGSVVFVGASGVYAQDNANLFWDATNIRLGVGTSSPGAKLSIVPSQANANISLGNTLEGLAPGTSNGGAIYFGLGVTSASTPTGGIEASWGSAGTLPQIHFGLTRDGAKHRYSAFYDATLRMYTSDVERMRIDGSGNVGIGTSSPAGKVSTERASASAGWAYHVKTTGVANDSGIYMTASNNFEMVLRDSSTNLSLITNNGNNLVFSTAGTERLRIASAGQLGIGGANYGTSGQVLTSNGSASAPSWQSASAFPSGTAMLFVQTAAPTGWTKSITHDNKALRVVSGTASSGGSVAFTTAFASQTPAGTIGNTTATGTVGNTTLSTTQIPSHTHSYYNVGCGGTAYTVDFRGTDALRASTATGGGGSHNHSFTGDAHNHTFTGTAINLTVQYVDVIVATKD